MYTSTSTVEPHTHVIIEFYLQRVLPEVGVVIVHVGLDRVGFTIQKNFSP